MFLTKYGRLVRYEVRGDYCSSDYFIMCLNLCPMQL